MGEISKFNGMKISMYPFNDGFHNEHDPAHIHIKSRGAIYKFDLLTKEQIYDSKYKKAMPPNDKRKLIKWMKQHEKELWDNWAIAKSGSNNFKTII